MARDPASEKEIQDLIHEASEAARDDYGVDSANEWAGGFRFPEEYVNSDVTDDGFHVYGPAKAAIASA